MLKVGNLTSIFIGYTVIFTRITITWSEIQLFLVLTKETDYSTTSINNDHGDKHSNMSDFVLKSLFCFSWTMVCCHVQLQPIKGFLQVKVLHMSENITTGIYTAVAMVQKYAYPICKEFRGLLPKLPCLSPLCIFIQCECTAFEGLLYWSKDMKITRRCVQAICRIFDHLPWHGIQFVLNSVRHMGSG